MSTDLADLLRTSTNVAELVRFGRYCSEKMNDPGFFTNSERVRYESNVRMVIDQLRELGYDEASRLFANEHLARKKMSRLARITDQAVNTAEIEREFRR